MRLRDPALLLSLVGLPAQQLPGVLRQEVNAFSQAVSSEGLLAIRKFWDGQCSTLPRTPAATLLQPGSAPRGLAPPDFQRLLGRLTDLAAWQIWDLWAVLDVHACGFVGCQEFTLLVVLMCAALSCQQLPAVHAYQRSICRVFAGAHVGSSYAGLAQCCRLLGVPVSGLAAALRLQAQPGPPPAARSGAGSCSLLPRPPQQPRPPATAAGAGPPGAGGALGCCCASGGCQQQQWACGAAAHRKHAASCGSRGARLLRQQASQQRHQQPPAPASLMAPQDVALVLFELAQRAGRRQAQQSAAAEGGEGSGGCCVRACGCTIC